MANSWLRLWHDMPNDPKWRTISRVSGQPMALVQSVYIHLLVSASQNVTRGHADVTSEDLASHFDVTQAEIDSVISAMQGRVLDGNHITGWERRQPKREDQGNPESSAKSAAERKAAQRERDRLQKEKSQHVTLGHDESRGVTPDKDKEKIREDIKDPPISPTGDGPPTAKSKPKSQPIDYQSVVDAYNECADGKLPLVQTLNEKRRRDIKRLLSELTEPTPEAAKAYFQRFMDSAKPWHFGDNDRGWVANFDYLLKSKTLVNTREGSL
jgi:hypothetical protein